MYIYICVCVYVYIGYVMFYFNINTIQIQTKFFDLNKEIENISNWKLMEYNNY